MKRLEELLAEFWIWTQFSKEKWTTTDLARSGINSFEFPRIGEICNVCIELINTPLNPKEINMFLMGMAIDAEDEDILDECIKNASDEFLYSIVSYGVSHPQSDARWQLAELLHRPIPQRDYFINILLFDSDEYVRKRAHITLRDLYPDRM